MLSALNKSNLGSQLLYLNISSRSVPGLGLGLGLHGAGDNINLETRRADMWRYVDHFIISGFWIICCDTNNPVNVLTEPPLPPPACSPCQDHFFTDSISTSSQFTDNKLPMQVFCTKAGSCCHVACWPKSVYLSQAKEVDLNESHCHGDQCYDLCKIDNMAFLMYSPFPME